MARRHFQRRCAWIAGCVLAAAAAHADEAYSLKRVYRAGDVDRYRTVITMEAENPTGLMTLEFTVLTTESVKEVKPDGAATVETKVDRASLVVKDKVNTASSELNDTTSVLTTYDASGKETKRTVTSENGQAGPALMMVGLARATLIPTKSMKAGEEWKYDIPAPDAKSARRAGTVTVVGRDKRSDGSPGDAVKLKCTTVITTPGQMGDEKVNLVSTVALDPATGKPLDIDATGSGKLGPLNAKRITIRQAIVGAAANKDAKP